MADEREALHAKAVEPVEDVVRVASEAALGGHARAPEPRQVERDTRSLGGGGEVLPAQRTVEQSVQRHNRRPRAVPLPRGEYAPIGELHRHLLPVRVLPRRVPLVR